MPALSPKIYGGTGLSALDFALAAEELADVDIHVPTMPLATGLALEPRSGFGTPAQQRHGLAQRVAQPADQLVEFAFTEVTGGANFDCPEPRPACTPTLVVRATTGSATGGHTTHPRCWLVWARRAPADRGLSHGAHAHTRGIAGGHSGIGRHRLGGRLSRPGGSSRRGLAADTFQRGAGARGQLAGSTRSRGRELRACVRADGALLGAACRGEVRAAFELALESAKNDRRAGNVPVSELQNLGYMLADSKMRIEAARYLTWKACHYLDTTERAGPELASISKVRAAELWVQVAHDPMRAVGVESYPSRSPLAGLRQDA